MNVQSITRIAGLVGEAARIQMLITLLDGSGHSASELATVAAVSPPNASVHLSKLVNGGLVVAESRGRQRVFRLKNRDVAAAIEALGGLAPNSAPSVIPELRFARTCYDHLAGVLAIAMRNELLKRDAVRLGRDGFVITPAGKRLLGKIDIDVDALRQLRRSFAHKCLDWTERHHHIGGAVGAALLSRLFEMKWVARMHDTRAVRLTHTGERGFEDTFKIRCAALRASGGIAPGPA